LIKIFPFFFVMADLFFIDESNTSSAALRDSVTRRAFDTVCARAIQADRDLKELVADRDNYISILSEVSEERNSLISQVELQAARIVRLEGDLRLSNLLVVELQEDNANTRRRLLQLSRQ